LNSNEEKDFYNSLSFPNLTSVILNNCKFKCYDAFERFFSNLSDTENTIKLLAINRLNSVVSAKGFGRFLLTQLESLESLTLNGVHKNILSRKYHKKVLPILAQMPNLRHLSLSKNQLDFARLQSIVSQMTSESFQELQTIDLSQNLMENNGVLCLYKMLKGRYVSAETVDVSGNRINEEGLNLFLKGKIHLGEAPLARGLIANQMIEKNYIVNNPKGSKLERLELS